MADDLDSPSLLEQTLAQEHGQLVLDLVQTVGAIPHSHQAREETVEISTAIFLVWASRDAVQWTDDGAVSFRTRTRSDPAIPSGVPSPTSRSLPARPPIHSFECVLQLGLWLYWFHAHGSSAASIVTLPLRVPDLPAVTCAPLVLPTPVDPALRLAGLSSPGGEGEKGQGQGGGLTTGRPAFEGVIMQPDLLQRPHLVLQMDLISISSPVRSALEETVPRLLSSPASAA
ncbi:hypothetical protein GGTG_08169 [Gaeumannomyces tritici R3-111a-1]|uniref:Uncharacterized protein n=1 Tax=Gaeumannomyces tritici (strain R3-111a-1) TaxID=644352 RepID=J3P3T4_GAET3|nr:hypothetical protein GGTG_08169 [Gaeumannomyces tritici R3-111a-1]EJT74328.1 hypothetical protein GGTG_08169 [Gaeumannomyces tritici R3-111a-1]